MINNYYYGARYYNPKTSIWLSVDPLTEQRLGISPYNYVQNNPLNRIDPTGALDESVQNPDDIIFSNNNGEELGRVVMEGDDINIKIDTDISVDNPVIVNVNDLKKELGVDKLDAIGIGVEYSATVGGGLNAGFEAVYFLSGKNQDEAFLYDKIGGNVGYEGSVGAYGFVAVKGDNNVTADSWVGKSNSFSVGYETLGFSYFWTNTDGSADIFPGLLGDVDWQGVSVPAGLSARAGGKWSVSDYSYAEWAGDKGKIYSSKN
ncbi:RHS repeat-associated core domain-containing protein [Neptunitalea lumnitzerae]|uniref:RHS repeat-associated core domain-containing protein n=1 Tax=Neptunitalea lumnitzerae TaxID=2965509 RepID=A0ABQ5MIR4_9FLAO|nr:RHS repeat-associated core domain-containing protein [Neptunitalea sp. Y10]GLB49270.1 hypothetical protein Y10_16380 [Neptunitalea sp. Y10]